MKKIVLERLTRRKENATREMTVMKTEEKSGDEGKERRGNSTRETRESICHGYHDDICNNQKMEAETRKRRGR